ncbi:phasin family protein [Motiliproteus coralliicola]|uniref:Phasin family protein n=1 Tax=Motiliproteus coralliicola TaxID=2283196 RepID=A0A369WTV1_9GAMM|nr:phasin family protein [Motiliproteus coralliicola]RDE24563.1 phasin family protein [Motiliproteus coralliicola]
MYESTMENVKSSLQPLVELAELNRKAVEQIATAQADYLKECISTSIKQVQSLTSTQSAQRVTELSFEAAKSFEDQFNGIASQNLATLNELRDGVEDVLSSSYSDNMERINELCNVEASLKEVGERFKAVTENLTPAAAPVAAPVAKPAAKKAAPKKAAAPAKKAAPAAKKSAAKPAVKAETTAPKKAAPKAAAKPAAKKAAPKPTVADAIATVNEKAAQNATAKKPVKRAAAKPASKKAAPAAKKPAAKKAPAKAEAAKAESKAEPKSAAKPAAKAKPAAASGVRAAPARAK